MGDHIFWFFSHSSAVVCFHLLCLYLVKIPMDSEAESSKSIGVRVHFAEKAQGTKHWSGVWMGAEHAFITGTAWPVQYKQRKPHKVLPSMALRWPPTPPSCLVVKFPHINIEGGCIKSTHCIWSNWWWKVVWLHQVTDFPAFTLPEWVESGSWLSN